MEEEDPPREPADFSKITMECARILELDSKNSLTEIQKAIEQCHAVFEVEHLVRELEGSTKDQKILLRKIRRQLAKTAKYLVQLPPSISVAVGQLGRTQADEEALNRYDLVDDLGRWVNGIDAFLELYSPPKGAPGNMPLRLAMVRLLPLLERLAGEQATISWHKHDDQNPEPNNQVASAVVHVLRQFSPMPSQTTILNMVERLHSEPQEPDDYLDMVTRTHLGFTDGDDDWFEFGPYQERDQNSSL